MEQLRHEIIMGLLAGLALLLLGITYLWFRLPQLAYRQPQRILSPKGEQRLFPTPTPEIIEEDDGPLSAPPKIIDENYLEPSM